MCREKRGDKPCCTVVLLAGGSGRRMGADKAKQYLTLAGRPLIWHSLRALEQSEVVDDCVLVLPEADIPHVMEEIVRRGGFRKVRAAAPGGRERYESVWHGLQALRGRIEGGAADAPAVIMIHDGARPCLTGEILERCFRGAAEYGACVAAVPSKDTVTLADGDGFEESTPNRRYVWNVQTPQAFRTEVIYPAFRRLAAEMEGRTDLEPFSWITDDASVARHYMGARIRLVQGDYRNIKVTTGEDLQMAELLLSCERKF